MTITSPTAAADAAEEILATRPRVRRDILYTQVPEGALFHDAKTGFRVHGRTAYRFATLVVPHLDGSCTVDELCAGLGDAQRAMVMDLVSTLYSHGFARAVPAPDPDRAPAVADAVRRRFAAQIAYVDHHVDDAVQRFARWRDTRVAVVGDDEVARWVALGLLRNGVAAIGVGQALLDRHADVVVEADGLRDDGCDVRLEDLTERVGNWHDLSDYDVVVLTPGGDRTRLLLALVTAGVPAGRTLLPVWQVGGQVAIGPAMRAGTTGCWVCAALRIGANGDAGAAADLWTRAAGVGALPRPLAGPLAAMVGNLVGYEIFRLTTGALPVETDGKVIVQDADSLDVAVEPLRPHPACPHCRPAEAPSTSPSNAAEVAVPSGSPQRRGPLPEPGSPESERRLALLAERAVLVGHHLGVFRRFDDDLLVQTPLRVSTVEVAVGPGRRRRIAAVDVHNVAGARIAALTAAARVYADSLLVPQVTADTGGKVPVRPDELATATGLVTPEHISAWAPTVSLLTGDTLLVPAAAVSPRSAHNDRRAFRAGGGPGADSTPAQARCAALLAALGDDALQAALHGEVPLLTVECPWDEDDPVLTFLGRTAANLGAEVALLELGDPGEQPAPVLLARATVGDDVVWAAAADLSWWAAAVTAVTDLLGRIQLGDTLPGGDAVDLGDPWVADLAPQTLVASGAVAPRRGLQRTFPEVMDRLRAQGRDVLTVDLPAADLAIGKLSVARVLLRGRADEH